LKAAAAVFVDIIFADKQLWLIALHPPALNILFQLNCVTSESHS